MNDLMNDNFSSYILTVLHTPDYDFLTYDKVEYDQYNQQLMLKYCASHSYSEKFFQYAEYHPIDLTFEDNFLFKCAVSVGCYSIVEYLIGSGIDVNCCDDYAVRYAAGKSKEILQLLIENGADFRVDDDLPLKRAVSTGMKECVKFLLENGADPNTNNDDIAERLIMLMAKPKSQETYLSIISMLIDYGLDLNVVGEKLLIHTAIRGNHSALKYLIDQGVSPSCINTDDLSYIVTLNSYETIKLLVDNRVDFTFINEMDESTESNLYKIHRLLTNTGVNSDRLLKLMTEN